MKLLMVSLGCDKNLVDSEKMLGVLTRAGFEITDDENEAEAAVVNTCCFIDDAKKESIDQIFSLARLKETAKLKVLIVSGCMAQRYKDEILDEIPEIDGIVGTTGIDGIAKAITDALGGTRDAVMDDISTDPDLDPDERVITTGGHFAYLKIAEGCDKHCTYCAIPSFRGRYRSYPMEKLTAEAFGLAGQGVRELILVAEETTLYGSDIYGKPMLHVLLKRLCDIPGIEWIRILYCYPEDIYPELVDVMAEEPKICHYLDMPVQHASDAVLRRMSRRTTEAELIGKIRLLREKIPDIALRTTLISGFPGETDEDHQILMDFVRRMKFDRLGVFTYSREEGTPAASMEPQIPEEIMEKRRDEIMTLQQEISAARGQSLIGKTMRVFTEGSIPEDGVYVGRTYADAPSVDGLVFFQSERSLMSGDFVNVRITGASEYDLEGTEEYQDV
jgi:ribosomal protein S12 methylthiotransferase